MGREVSDEVGRKKERSQRERVMASGFHVYPKVSGADMAMSDVAVGGGNPGSDESMNDCTVREQDQFMPSANVIRIMRKILPPHAKISDDAKETIQECVSEYISFITGEANERCQREQRKTITAEDIRWAMSKLGFSDYIDPLTVYLLRYRELEGNRGLLRGDPLMKRNAPTSAADYPSLDVPGFHQVYQHGYFGASAVAYNMGGGLLRDGINHDSSSYAPTVNGEADLGRFERSYVSDH